MPSLTDIKHLIINMDGVLYLGDQPMPRLRELSSLEWCHCGLLPG